MLSKRLKIGSASILSCLALLFGLFSLTGTASAHSAHSVHPRINIEGEQVNTAGKCVAVAISGSGFAPSREGQTNHAQFDASDTNGDSLSVDPGSVQVDGDGNFSATVNLCGLVQRLLNPGTAHCVKLVCPTRPFFKAEISVEASDEATGHSSAASFGLSF